MFCKALKQSAQGCGEVPIPGSVQRHMDMALKNTVYCGHGGGARLDLMILKVISSLNHSVSL